LALLLGTMQVGNLSTSKQVYCWLYYRVLANIVPKLVAFYFQMVHAYRLVQYADGT